MKTSNLISLGLLAGVLTGCATSPAAPTHTIAPVDAPTAPAPSDRSRTTPAEQSETVPFQDTPAPASEKDEWRFVISPYGWLLSVDGSATVDGTASTIDEDFDDIIDTVNFVAEARFEAWKNAWGMMADITYAELENDFKAGAIKGDTNTDMVLGFYGGMFRFVDRKYADAYGGLTVDAILGAAYTSIDAELDLKNAGTESDDKDWVDVIVGMRSRFQVNEKWGGSLEAIIGGFGLTDGSDLVTMYTAMVGRKLGKSGHLYFGWRTLDIDYDEGDNFKLNININGPIVGYEWSF